MPDVSNLKLGKKLGVVHDPRTFQLRRLLTGEDVKPPAHASVAHTIQSFPVFGNDQFGDCGFAAYGHSVIARERSAQQDNRKVDLTTAQILNAYFNLTGGADSGIYLLDGCRYFKDKGVGRDENGQPHRIQAYAQVQVRDHTEVKRALWQFGGLYIGAGLPVSAQGQVGGLWDVTGPPDQGDSAWGSWGGHAMYALQYDAHGLEVVTWGQRQPLTWAWWDAYVDEAYVHITDDYLRKSGKTPQGFDVQALEDALARL